MTAPSPVSMLSSSATTQTSLIRPSVTVRTSMVRISTGRPVGAISPRGVASGPVCRPCIRNTITMVPSASIRRSGSGCTSSSARCNDRALARRSAACRGRPLTGTGSV